MSRLLLALAAFLAFTGWSTWITLQHGFWGFLDVPTGSDWGAQVFVDLAIALVLLFGFLRRDAREHGIPWLPYLIGMLILGSISPLAYMVHREWVRLRAD